MEVSVASEKLSVLLKESRLEKGYSESELGGMMGLSHASISHWEGKPPHPPGPTVAAACGNIRVGSG